MEPVEVPSVEVMQQQLDFELVSVPAEPTLRFEQLNPAALDQTLQLTDRSTVVGDLLKAIGSPGGSAIVDVEAGSLELGHEKPLPPRCWAGLHRIQEVSESELVAVRVRVAKLTATSTATRTVTSTDAAVAAAESGGIQRSRTRSR